MVVDTKKSVRHSLDYGLGGAIEARWAGFVTFLLLMQNLRCRPEAQRSVELCTSSKVVSAEVNGA